MLRYLFPYQQATDYIKYMWYTNCLLKNRSAELNTSIVYRKVKLCNNVIFNVHVHELNQSDVSQNKAPSLVIAVTKQVAE